MAGAALMADPPMKYLATCTRGAQALMLACFMAASLSVLDAQAVQITGSGTYSQNFDTLPVSGLPTWVDNSTIADWYAQRTGSGNSVVADDGTLGNKRLYSFGTGTQSDRALGAIPGTGGSVAPGDLAWGVVFQVPSTTTGLVNMG